MPLTLNALAHVCFKNKNNYIFFPTHGSVSSGKDHDLSSYQCLDMKLFSNENWVKTNDYVLGDF
jgi:hypothetical protein